MKKDALSWLLFSKYPVIHRGVIRGDCLEHSWSAFQICIEQGYPMEVDLLMLGDQEIVVWRDERVSTVNNEKCWLSSMSLPEIRTTYSDLDSRLRQMMTLEEFTAMVDGKVGIIFEIKVPYGESPNIVVDSVLSVLSKYRGDFAIHSSNPHVIHRIHTLCPDIPIGQISLSFKWIPDVSPEYIRLHREFLFTDIAVPDFLNYDIRDLAEENTRKMVIEFCQKYDIPLLSWTIKNSYDEELAREYCKNYIIEGAKSYVK